MSFYDNFYELRRTSAVSFDVFSTEDAEQERVWLLIPLKVGIVIAQEVEVGAMYSPTIVLSQGNFPYKYGINSIQAGVTYHF